MLRVATFSKCWDPAKQINFYASFPAPFEQNFSFWAILLNLLFSLRLWSVLHAEQHCYPLVSCLSGIAVLSCVMVLNFVHCCVCTKSLNYGMLSEAVCGAWAKLWDIFSLCWPCHGPYCISLGNSCWVASFSLSHITLGYWKAGVSCQTWDFWDGCFPTGNAPILA